MEIPKFRTIKTRKEHICIGCNNPIIKGSICQFMAFRQPIFNTDDIQIGIKYIKIWHHSDDLSCWLIN